jgi:plasmid stabilization system protein ParE
VTLRVSTTPEADAQVRAIDEWWRENRLAARDLFLRELAAAFETMAHTPLLGRVYRQSPVPGTRRILLKRCRYHVYYVVHAGEITVLAVWHAGRGAGPPLRMS